jgi:Ca2+-transporting ATPase
MKSAPEASSVLPVHARTVDDVCGEFKSGSSGLGAAEVEHRQQEFGPNELVAPVSISPWTILLAQFRNVLIVILLIATGISAYLGHTVEAIAITVIVVFAVLLGFVQEYRAERAIEALRQMAAPNATVVRGGIEQEVPARELVPGDVVVLSAGNRVPGDARLIEAVNLQIQEAALTGESVAVEKHIAALDDPHLPLGDRRNMAYAGTVVTYGRGRAMVVATGMTTEFGKIAQVLQSVETGKTPLQENLDKLGRVLALAALVIVAVIVVLGLLRGQPILDMLVFGIALAVAVVPEALPAVVTISLAIGVQRLVRRNALMRRLPAIETLGSTSVICTDKTGTLTKDEMTARKVYVGGRVLDVSGTGYEPRGGFLHAGTVVEVQPPLARLLRAGVLASDARIIRDDVTGRWQVKGDPTEGGLVVAAAKAGLAKGDLDTRYPRMHEIPFSSESKRMTTLHEFEEDVGACAKGAPEVILDSCVRQLTPEGELPLGAADRAAILDIVQQLAGEGLRVIALADRAGATPENAESEMSFLGLVGMMDPPRPEVSAAIRTCESAGIRVVMITGDHPITAQAIARELGLLKGGRVVSGLDLDAMSDEELDRQIETLEVFARVSPAHKLRVVSALQKRGHIVAMTGDGVNDAPAVKKADIGIAMGITGTDVAKEVAAMTLTDDNFASIVAAVEEGRGIFGNIKKYLMYMLSSNIGEIGLMAGTAILGLPLPLTAVQILYVNLATDGLPALALAVDPPDRDLMRNRPRNLQAGIFSRPVVMLMIIGGAWSMSINLGLFAWALSSGRSAEEAMTMTFVTLVLIEFFKAYNFRSERVSAFYRPLANRWLNLAVLWELLLLMVIVYVPFMQIPFATFSLTFEDWGVIIALALTITPVLEATKWVVRRRESGRA